MRVEKVLETMLAHRPNGITMTQAANLAQYRTARQEVLKELTRYLSFTKDNEEKAVLRRNIDKIEKELTVITRLIQTAFYGMNHAIKK